MRSFKLLKYTFNVIHLIDENNHSFGVTKWSRPKSVPPFFTVLWCTLRDKITY